MAQVDDWASDTNFPAGSDPWSAQPTKVEPSASIKQRGFLPGTTPPAGWFNWLFNQIITALNLKSDSPGTVVDNEIPRWDGTNGQTFQTSGLLIDNSNELAYASTKSRTVYIPLRAVLPDMDSSGVPDCWFDFSVLGWKTRVNNADALIDLKGYVPTGAVITNIQLSVDPGNARATSGNRFSMTVLQGGAVADVRDDGTGSAQTLNANTSSSPAWSNITYNQDVLIQITGGDDAPSAHTADKFGNTIAVIFNDPGPRNY